MSNVPVDEARVVYDDDDMEDIRIAQEDSDPELGDGQSSGWEPSAEARKQGDRVIAAKLRLLREECSKYPS